jgi:hypothetical protein
VLADYFNLYRVQLMKSYVNGSWVSGGGVRRAFGRLERREDGGSCSSPPTLADGW